MNQKDPKQSTKSTASKHKTKKKTTSKRMRIFKKVMATVGKVFATMFLVGVITGCIVITALTVYVMKFSDTTDLVDISDLKENYTTILYANDSSGNPIEVEKLYSEENREWVDLEDIPIHVQRAFIATEDKRFYDHQGVDWKRTFASFANLFLHFYDTKQGGSTITQQVIKNVTNDDDQSIPRKVREIFRAMNMEREFLKDDILECYMNIIALGGDQYGVQAASKYYFNKDVKDLTLAEGASLAATIKSPNSLNPKKSPEKNKARRNDYTLKEMKKLGLITEEQYEAAIKEEIVVAGTQTDKTETPIKKVQSYFTDHIINEVIEDLMETYDWDKTYAQHKLYTAGYRIYTTMDIELQKTLEDKYKDPLTFYKTSKVKDPPQSAMIVLDYSGNIKAVVGRRGEKSQARVFNFATMANLGIGSSIKPLSVYAPMIDANLIHYSTLVQDSPSIKNQDGTMGPKNYEGKGTNQWITVENAIRVSKNTVPAKLLLENDYRQKSFDFMQNKLRIFSLVKSKKVTLESGKTETLSDVDYARLAMGSLVYGVKLSELAAAYEMFGNGGYYNEPVAYTKVTSADGKTIILEKEARPVRVISEETASVMNKLLQRVVEGPSGTGRYAKLSTHTVVGKTGTANDGKSQVFVGLTPYYIGAVWVGYETPKEFSNNVVYKPAVIWKNVLEGVHKKLPAKEFVLSGKMKELAYCTETGYRASANCPHTATGYYKSDNIPSICTKHLAD